MCTARGAISNLHLHLHIAVPSAALEMTLEAEATLRHCPSTCFRWDWPTLWLRLLVTDKRYKLKDGRSSSGGACSWPGATWLQLIRLGRPARGEHRQLLAGCLAAGGLARSLLRASHLYGRGVHGMRNEHESHTSSQWRGSSAQARDGRHRRGMRAACAQWQPVEVRSDFGERVCAWRGV